MAFLQITRNQYNDITGIKPQAGFYIVATLLVLVLLFFATMFRTVDAGQVGVVTRFGEVNRTADSGVALKLPFVETIHKMDTRTQRDEQMATAATADQQIVNTKVAVNFSLDRNKAVDIYKNVGVDYKDKILSNNLQAAYKGVSAQYSAADLLTKRGEVEDKSKQALIARLATVDNGKWNGIKIEGFSVVDFGFSAAFDAAIEAKQVAQQDALKAGYLAEKARNEAAAAIEQAKGQSESQRLLQATASAQTIELKRLEVQQQMINEVLKKWNGQLPTTTLSDTINSLFSLPAAR